MAHEFSKLPFEPYAPVRQQLLIILRAVNRARKAAGLEPVPWTCIRLKRRIYRPFESGEAAKPEQRGPRIAGGFIFPRGIDPEVSRSLLGQYGRRRR
jgi:hypothetical protein